MIEFERRVRSSLRELTDALAVDVPARPPPPVSDRNPSRLGAAALAVCAAIVVGLIVWWPSGADPDRLTLTSQPGSSVQSSPTTPATSQSTAVGRGDVLEPPIVYWAVIDSVMAEATALLPTVTVEPSPAGALAEVVAAARELRAAGRLASVTIVHVGTDGPLDKATFDALIDAVRQLPHVVVVTTHGDQPWTAANNALIHAVDQPDDNIDVFDWAQRALECPGDCFTDDGIDLTTDGRWFYAEQLAGFVGLEVPERPVDPSSLPVAAITADGDAVIIPPGADAPELVFDGPADGAHLVTGVAHSTEQDAVFVSMCCEPISGEIYRIPLDDPSRPAERLDYAMAAAVSPTGRGLATVSPEGVSVGDVTFTGTMGIAVPSALGSIYDLDWFDTPTIDNPGSPFPDLTGQLAALSQTDAGIQLITMTDVARIAAIDHATVIHPDRGASISLAGVTSDGRVLVHDQARPEHLAAYDPITLQAAGTISLPAAALSAWVEGDRTIWIDSANQLHIDDTTIAGSYRWARQ